MMSSSRDFFGQQIYNNVRGQDPLTQKKHLDVIEKNAANDKFQERAREAISLYNASQLIRPTLGSYMPSNKAVVFAVAGIITLAALSGCLGGDPTGLYVDAAQQNVTESQKNCEDYLAGNGARDVQMDVLCSDVKTLEKQETGLKSGEPKSTATPAVAATVVATSAPANAGDVIYDSDGKGLDMDIDGVDWRTPDLWYLSNNKDSFAEALGVKRIDQDIYLMYVERVGGVRKNLNGVNILGRKKSVVVVMTPFWFTESGFYFVPFDENSEVYSKYKDAGTTSIGRVKQKKLDGYAGLLDEYMAAGEIDDVLVTMNWNSNGLSHLQLVEKELKIKTQ